MDITKIITSAALAALALSVQAQEAMPSDSLSRELQEIVVTAKQPATRLVGSTLVSTIAGSNLQHVGTAFDVLAQLPMIQVHDDEVSVTGRSNIEIYIDGRPLHDTYQLQQLQSENIRKVELLMAPGASYASTTGAVLKITTRRAFVDGLSVTDRLQVKARRKWSVMDYLDLNYRSGRWDFFADGSYNHDNSVIKGSTTNSLDYLGQPTMVGASQHNSFSTDAATVRGGFNYASDTQSFGAYYRFNPEHGDFTNQGDEWLDDLPPIARIIGRNTNGHSHLVSAYYDGMVSPKVKLHFDGDFRHAVSDNDVNTAYPSGEYATVNSTDHKSSTLYAGKLYMEMPLLRGSLTAGTQDSYTHTSLDYRMLNSEVNTYIPSSVTDARQVSAALFASWQRQYGRFDLSVGARYEYVDYLYKVNGMKDDAVSRTDHMLTPDISLGYSFSDRASLSLSYRMATVRPPYAQLTNSLSYVGLHEIEGGNPALRDEKMHDLQLSGMYGDFMLQADLVRSTDTYAYVKQLYPTSSLQLLMHPVNVDVTALSMYLVWSRSIRFWTPNVTMGMYKQWMQIDGTHYPTPIFSYYLDNTFALPHGWTIAANLSGQSTGDMHTNRFGGTWLTMDASVSKSLMSNALTLSLSATDIFNTSNNDWTMHTYGIQVAKHQSYDRRGITINITYRLHPRKSKYKGTSASESELRRL